MGVPSSGKILTTDGDIPDNDFGCSEETLAFVAGVFCCLDPGLGHHLHSPGTALKVGAIGGAGRWIRRASEIFRSKFTDTPGHHVESVACGCHEP